MNDKPCSGHRAKITGAMWRIGRLDVDDYIEEAYRRTAERIAAGELEDEGESDRG
ncbi:hypothetical protein [Arthrobacter sp. NicSoilB11]|uniref:hypothetical protein n=1 Tax=Arthrobacter sp. NicSoilB11 TaxID=2830999 RepID=UPI001CC6F381|nr:hypothetical protein [Arthrobacter sp. NicSoilB11]